MNALLDDLCWRGLIAHSTDLEALGAHLDEGPVKFYVGFDPTAPSLHMGNLVQLLFARRLQQAGHKPHLLVGGATGQIGDPKETGERRGDGQQPRLDRRDVGPGLPAGRRKTLPR